MKTMIMHPSTAVVRQALTGSHAISMLGLSRWPSSHTQPAQAWLTTAGIVWMLMGALSKEAVQDRSETTMSHCALAFSS